MDRVQRRDFLIAAGALLAVSLAAERPSRRSRSLE